MDTEQEMISETPDGLGKKYAIEGYKLEITDADSGTVLYDVDCKTMELAKEQAKVFLKKIFPKEGLGKVFSQGVESLTVEELLCILSFNESLPSDCLLQKAKTQKQKILGVFFRNELAPLVSRCLFWRFNRLDGDPLRPLLLTEVPEDKLLHAFVWGTVGATESLYNLMQLLWNPISLEISSTQDAPTTSFDLLLEVIRESFDYPYENYLTHSAKKRRLNPRTQEALSVALMTYWKCPSKLTANQEETLKKHQNLTPPFWLSTILSVARRDIRLHGNIAAKSLLNEYFYKVGEISNETARWYRKYRKEGSISTIDG